MMPGVIAVIAAAVAALFYPKQAGQIVERVKQDTATTVNQVFGPNPIFGPSNRWTAQQVMEVAQEYRSRYSLNADPVMVAAMAQIESSFNPYAERFEAHLNDSSYGLMQTMLNTALWLYNDMGYRAFGRPTAQTLKDGRTSIYFGMAYINWLSRWNRIARSEEWIVESYNGGPNNSNSMTQNHLRKYRQAKAQIIGVA